MSLFQTALHALKWSVLTEIVSRAVGAVMLLVLARLLIPEDFGVVAAATVVISLSQVFADAGLEKTLIQRQTRIEESASIVFWLNLAFGLVVAAILVIGAPFIARFFHDERIAGVVRLLSLQIPLTALSTVHAALLKKDLSFGKLFWVRLLTTTAGAAASIPLAIYGMGYWALVAGTLFGVFAQAIVLWLRSSWRPRWGLEKALSRELGVFGSWVMLSALLGWFYIWMDAIVVGHYLGSRDLGLYRTGSMFTGMVFGLIFSPLIPVLYSLLSRAQHDLPKMREAMQTVAHGSALVAIPVGGYLYTVSEDLGDVVFGTRWHGVAMVIALIGLKDGIAWVVGMNGEVYRAMGKPHIDTWVNGAMLGVYLAGYVVAVQYGLRTFLQMRFALALLAICAHLLVARFVLKMPFRNWLFGGTLLTTIVAVTLVMLWEPAVNDSLVRLFLDTALFGVLTAGGLALFERRFLGRLFRLARADA